MTGASEEQLSGGGVTDVKRIGRTVRRPVRPFTATVQTYLRYVRAHGATFVPEPLGYDKQGREVLEFIAGDVPQRPLPEWALADDVIEALARMIRRLHTAATGFQPPSDAVWGSIPGAPVAGVEPLFETPELVSHRDYCPGNVVFRAGLPVALIDFDLARPTTRVVDCVNAIQWWAPLAHPDDRPASLSEHDVAERVALFASSYGLTPAERGEVVPLAVRMAQNNILTMQAAAAVDPVFAGWWHDDAERRLPRALQWLTGAGRALAAALTA